MVLGYYDREVTGYIYREVYINSIIGIIFGYPVSVLLIALVFSIDGNKLSGGKSPRIICPRSSDLICS